MLFRSITVDQQARQSRLGGREPALARLLVDRYLPSAEARHWFVLTPLHLVAGLSTVHHHVGGPVRLGAAAARSIAEALAAEFGDADARFDCLDGEILMGLSGALDVATTDPAQLAGRDLADGVATGPDARRLARLCGEFELWLHGRGVLGSDGRRVHALHPWGQGGSPVGSCPVPLRILCDDPFLRAASCVPAGSLGPDAPALCVWSVADLLATGVNFEEADRLWAASLLARLREGEVAAAEVYAGGRAYEVSATQRWRVWRKARPWWEVVG